MIYMNYIIYIYFHRFGQIHIYTKHFHTLLNLVENKIQNISSNQPFNHPTNFPPSLHRNFEEMYTLTYIAQKGAISSKAVLHDENIIQAQVFETPKITAWFIVSIRVIWKPHDLLQNPKKIQSSVVFKICFFIMMSWTFWTNRLRQVDQVIRYFAVIFRLEPFQVSTNPYGTTWPMNGSWLVNLPPP